LAGCVHRIGLVLISLEEARAHVLGRVAPLPPVRTRAIAAVGCVLAEAVTSPEDVPPFANTAMDGYAVRAADTAGATVAAPVVLPVVAEVAAGHPAGRALQAGEAMRIFTGAPMPDGADAVLMVEHTTRLDDGARVALAAEVAPGEAVRVAGDDLRVGDAVFAPGEVITPGHLGVLAGIGVTEVLAHPRPRVGVLSTGDELVEAGRALAPGQIRDSNRATLLALVAQNGWQAVDLGLIRDDEAAITQAITDGAASCDAVITSGGVSMGDIDLVKVVLDRIGDMRWMQIAIRPAKPFAFGLVGGASAPVFGLPGNPVSSMVSFELLARPALRRIAGHADVLRAEVPAVAAEAFSRRPDGKTHFVRVLAERDPTGVLRVRSAGGQGSHHLTAMARAHALLPIADGDGVTEGEDVRVLLLADI
jgi:molybdopterin molybdotransferase